LNCPLCDASQSTVFATWPNFTVSECLGCGFRFVDTMDPKYPKDAQYVFDEAEIGLIRPDLPHIQRRVSDILRFKQPPGRSLDIGCGKGEVALALQQQGFEATGLDMKSNIMTHLQSHYPNVEWRCATTLELAELSQCYDILTLYHVLEHVTDPRSVLASVKRLANPGALIVVEVPNVGGWKAKLKGRQWDYYKVDHVNYFRAGDLRRLAESLDLKILDIRGYQHFSYPQHVLWKDAVKGMFGWLGFKDVISVFLQVV